MDYGYGKHDALVVLQTESGEQIALPMSALPSDFVPGDSGQIVMVESALDEQHEIVVESSEVQSTSENSLCRKQRRKETLITRSLYEEDIELKFEFIEEPSTIVKDARVERKPRKKYMTKNRIKIEKLSETNPQPLSQPKSQPQQQPQTERRTRLSNTCRVATGKSYKCNDCEFSTDRINNIILHVKESCPNLKRK